MKKIVMLGIAALMVSAAYAIDPAPATGMATAIIQKGSSVKLFYKASDEATVRVSIYNGTGSLVFSETLKQMDGFVRPYDFQKLPYGDYRIVVANGVERRVEHVTYSLEGIAHTASMIKLEEGRKYLLVVPNKSAEVLSITVTDQQGRTVHSSKHELEGDFSTLLNVADLDGGHFTVSLTDSKGAMKSFSY